MKQAKKILALILSVAMVVSLTPAIGFAAEGDPAGDSGNTTESGYVLMNIPYADFYKAELGEGAAEVDAVASATKNKPRTGGLAGGSYHKNADGTDISGVIYPVFVEDMSQLAGLKEITDESSVDITVTNRGQTSTTTYSGKEALFESDDYSYYKLTDTPAFYKTLTVGDDKKFSFSAVNGKSSEVKGVTGNVTLGTYHADVEISLSGTEGIETGSAISGVVLTFENGSKMGLKHVENIWRATELGGSVSELSGKTITNIRYYTQNSVIDYPVNIEISDAGYVLMNIPYADFYKEELGEGAVEVDAVTSATKNKPRTGGLAGGSYHKNPDGTDISGVIYPVFVEDMSQLKGLTEVTDESSVEITVTNRGTTTTTTYSGKDALFESADYSYYKLTEKPARYKTMTVGEDGAKSFGAVSGRASSVEGAKGTVTVGGRHADIEIALSGTTGIETGSTVSAAVLTFDDSSKMGLKHVENIWRATELGGSVADLGGKKITNVRYYTQKDVIDYPVEITVSDAGYFLMNIPYDKFYEAEGAADVDVVTAATKKAYDKERVDGSYHEGTDTTGETDILGVTFPVFIEDKSVLDTGKAVATEEELFSAGDYAYLPMKTTPASYKKAVLGDEYSFSVASGRAEQKEGVTADITVMTKRGDYEIELNGDALEPIKNGTVFGVVLTTEDGTNYAFRHLENIYKGTELAFCTGHTKTIKDGAVTPVSYEKLEGATIKEIKFFTKGSDGTYKNYIIKTDTKIPDYPTAEFSSDKKVKLNGLTDNDLETILVNKESGKSKYYVASVYKGDNILVEKAAINNDGTIDLDNEAVSGTEYTIDIIQVNSKKDPAEESVFASMKATYKKQSSSSSGNKDNIEPEPVPMTDPEHPSAAFEDLDTSMWYCEGTDFVIENGMMNGVSEKLFAPNATTNRAMIVTILWRMEGSPSQSASQTALPEGASQAAFEDVEAGSWYEDAVNWAAAEGIVNGMSETTFAPTAEITREQMSTILYRYAGYKGKVDEELQSTNLLGYDDVSSVSDWAMESMHWSVGAGLMKGVTETTLQPQGSATRAQVAVLMQRLCENVLK